MSWTVVEVEQTPLGQGSSLVAALAGLHVQHPGIRPGSSSSHSNHQGETKGKKRIASGLFPPLVSHSLTLADLQSTEHSFALCSALLTRTFSICIPRRMRGARCTLTQHATSQSQVCPSVDVRESVKHHPSLVQHQPWRLDQMDIII